MKKEKSMMNKMIAVVAAVVLVVVVGFVAMRGGFGGMFMMGGAKKSDGDLVVVNDSQDTFSTAYMRSGKTMSQVVKPGEKATGGKGLLRIFVANKNGNYEIQYPYPRPAGKPAEITLSQVLKVVHNPQLDQELYVEKGKIADIRVDYEEVRDME